MMPELTQYQDQTETLQKKKKRKMQANVTDEYRCMNPQ